MSNEELIQALRAALEANPTSVPLRKHLGDLLMESGTFGEAAKAYRQALDLAPKDSEIKLALCRAYERQGSYDVALAILETLLQEKAPPPEALLLAARAYLATEQRRQAAQVYRRAIEKDPSLADPELQEQLTVPETESPPREQIRLGDDLVFVVGDEDKGAGSDMVERPGFTFKDVGGVVCRPRGRQPDAHPLHRHLAALSAVLVL